MVAQTQMQINDDVVLDRLNAAMDAFDEDDIQKMKEINATIPLPSTVAKQMKAYMSKEDILDLGYDLSLANAELGEDWLNEPTTI